MKFRFAILILVLSLGSASAQTNRYIIFLKDKSESNYSVASPSEFLSERSVQRRLNQGIEITEQDIPVSESYMTSLFLQDVEVIHRSRWLNAVLISAEQNLLPAIEQLSFVMGIEEVASGSYSGARFNNFGHNSRIKKSKAIETDAQNNMLGAGLMQSEGYRGEGIFIAIMDEGFEGVDKVDYFQHIFTNDRLIDQKDFVSPNSSVFSIISAQHGTKVLSCMGGLKEDEFYGTAYNASFLLYATEDPSGENRIEEYNWLFAAERADSAGVDIINTSLGYTEGFDNPEMDYNYSHLDGQSTVISRAAAIAAEKGILIVTSAGNEGNIPWQYVAPPADIENGLAVGSIYSNGLKSPSSSIGPTYDGRIKPDVVAMGVSVKLVNSAGKIVTGSGTSYAAPTLAGFAAGIWQSRPQLTNFELIELIKSIGDNTEIPDNQFGYGLPDYSRLSEINGAQLSDIHLFKIFPNPSTDGLFNLVSNNESSATYAYTVYNTSGQAIINETRSSTSNSVQEVNLVGQPSGIYILEVMINNARESFQLVKN